MNLKERLEDIIVNFSEELAAEKIEELAKELAAEFAITYLVPSHYTVEETKEVFETFLAEKV